MTGPVTTRPRAVLICYACDPGAGSEEGVGWTWARAAAEVADVTLITSGRAADRVREAASRLDLPITVIEVDLTDRLRRAFPRKLIFVYYLLWHALAGAAVRRCERSQHVDVVHHVTWASDSLPSALLASRAPIRIWGPVGGSTRTARGLYRYLSPRGKVDQAVRDVVNGALRSVCGDRVAGHATLIAALNADVADRFRSAGRPIAVEGNLALGEDELPDAPAKSAATEPDGLRTALFVGRLAPWKGLLLSVRALVHAPAWRLVVFGQGRDEVDARALADALGVGDRIDFRRPVPRLELLAEVQSADALLAPSFHDSAPWSVGEAASLGCPVVCLDAGGSALMAGDHGHVVAIGDGVRLPERIGACLQGLGPRGAPDRRWLASRLPALLASWYGVAHSGVDASERNKRPSAEEPFPLGSDDAGLRPAPRTHRPPPIRASSKETTR
ncbi:MAG: glycosyltransferase [Actinomycetota bacterium]|nr:glycosyltransferase [Actinomycetota bacterium]